MCLFHLSWYLLPTHCFEFILRTVMQRTNMTEFAPITTLTVFAHLRFIHLLSLVCCLQNVWLMYIIVTNWRKWSYSFVFAPYHIFCLEHLKSYCKKKLVLSDPVSWSNIYLKSICNDSSNALNNSSSVICADWELEKVVNAYPCVTVLLASFIM